VSAVFLLTLVPERGPQPVATALPPAVGPVATPAEAPAPSPPPPRALPPPGLGPLGGAGGAQPRRAARALPVEREGATHYLPVETIVMVQANAHYTSVFDGRTHSFCSLSIGEVESRLDPGRFLRVHRSYIVAVDRIASLRRSGDGGTAQFDTAEPATAPVSRGRYTTLKRRMEASS
jgi:hypothetical protein